jgi:hypothetical protein
LIFDSKYAIIGNKFMKKKKIKVNAKDFIVFTRTKDDKFYQVCLNKQETDCVGSLINSLHNGTIKCLEKEFPFEEVKK